MATACLDLYFPTRGIDTRNVRAELVAALGEDLVFATTVRENANAAAHARKIGMLQYEYEVAAANQDPWCLHRMTCVITLRCTFDLMVSGRPPGRR